MLGKRRLSTLPTGYPKLEMKLAVKNGQTYFGTIKERLFKEAKAAAEAAAKAGSPVEASTSANSHVADIDPMA